jgi:hypothetical protein
MKEVTRRAIAFVVAARSNGHASSLYSCEQGRRTLMSRCADGAYDYEAGVHISGTALGLYHHGLGSHITLNVKGTSFSGYDHDEAHRFSGSVRGNAVQIYDHGERRHFSYSV